MVPVVVQALGAGVDLTTWCQSSARFLCLSNFQGRNLFGAALCGSVQRFVGGQILFRGNFRPAAALLAVALGA